ncbi:AraC-like DNA-binding protein [Terracoccus luteus]|uniref:AraC-like DNA-binding protein n=1 Tax=Terracoccus luteus TaxID=53356 RepID=A0A495Y2G7_9MICO|nr:AraC-like DNA-binding protein [Terracoccus luteus]
MPLREDGRVSRASEERNRALLRAKDAMDASYAQALDVDALARLACCSPSHFIRTFAATFGETPHRYLQRRRVERAMHLLRSTSMPVTEVCWAVGFASLGTFTRTFTRVVGETPTAYRGRGPLPPTPSCFAMAWLRPSSFGEARPGPGALTSAP